MAARPGAAVLPCLCFLEREGLRSLGWGMENKNTGRFLNGRLRGGLELLICAGRTGESGGNFLENIRCCFGGGLWRRKRPFGS